MTQPFLTVTVLLAGLSLAAFGMSAASAEQRKVEPTPRVQALLEADRPLVIAHRGYKMAAPENTIPSFEMALLAHADLIELDYYHSADNVLTVFHDSTLDRTTDAVAKWNEAKVTLAEKTFAELRELDAGAWFHPRFAGVQIPTVDEALDVIQAGSVTLIERKAGDPAALVELLEKKGILGDVVVQAFDWSFIAGCNEVAPGLALGALGPIRRPDGTAYPRDERYLNAMFLDQIEKTGARIVGWNRQVTREAIDDAHRRGLRVWIYTVNELDLALELLEMGVDGLISDNPAMAWKAIAIHQGQKQNPVAAGR